MSFEDTPNAYLVHQLVRRFRVRVPDKRGETDYFAAVAETISGLEGIDEVRVNPTTGSILILHPERPFVDFEAELASLRLFTLATEVEQDAPALAPVKSGLSAIDRFMRDITTNGMNLRTVTFVAMVAVALHQIRRGQYLGPALPMLWNAFELLMESRKDK